MEAKTPRPLESNIAARAAASEGGPTEHAAAPRSKAGAPSPAPAQTQGSRSLASTPILDLPPAASFATIEQLSEAIAVLEPYIVDLKRRRGNRRGAQKSAAVRASKRPPRAELLLHLEGQYGRIHGGIKAAAEHYRVDRRTIWQWMNSPGPLIRRE